MQHIQGQSRDPWYIPSYVVIGGFTLEVAGTFQRAQLVVWHSYQYQ